MKFYLHIFIAAALCACSTRERLPSSNEPAEPLPAAALGGESANVPSSLAGAGPAALVLPPTTASAALARPTNLATKAMPANVAAPKAASTSVAPNIVALTPPELAPHTANRLAGPESASAALAAPVAAAHPQPAFNSVDPQKAWAWLKNGNTRFVTKRLRADGQSAADRIRLAKGQHPHSIIVSCSDSRLPPELVFDQKLGEVFVTRDAGEVVDSSVVASVEYAVTHLGSRLIVVMGHESCGAVKAAIETPDGRTAGSPDLDRLVAEIRPRIAAYARKPASENVIDETTANALGAAQDLVKRSAIIREKVASGEVVIKSAVYHMTSGVVSWTNVE